MINAIWPGQSSEAQGLCAHRCLRLHRRSQRQGIFLGNVGEMPDLEAYNPYEQRIYKTYKITVWGCIMFHTRRAFLIFTPSLTLIGTWSSGLGVFKNQWSPQHQRYCCYKSHVACTTKAWEMVGIWWVYGGYFPILAAHFATSVRFPEWKVGSFHDLKDFEIS